MNLNLKWNMYWDFMKDEFILKKKYFYINSAEFAIRTHKLVQESTSLMYDNRTEHFLNPLLDILMENEETSFPPSLKQIELFYYSFFFCKLFNLEFIFLYLYAGLYFTRVQREGRWIIFFYLYINWIKK